MGRQLDTVTLTGRHVTLTPLVDDDAFDLAAAAAVDRSSYRFTMVPDGVAATSAYIRALIAAQHAGEALPFTQRATDSGRVLGCTRFMEPRWWGGRPDPDEVEIGGTWLAADAQRTGVNTEAKLLLLRHAFETLGVWRVAICTDADNVQSRTAIERIGARFEGILRAHRPRSGSTPPCARDTAVHAITRADWPDVCAGLERRLAAR